MCILLVEDEPLIREIMAESLQDAGFEVVEASTGDDARGLIRNAVEPFSILVTDFHMPGEADGAAVAQCIRQAQPEIPVIIATGRPDVFEAEWRRERQYALLRKPYTPNSLLDLVRRLLG